MIAQHMINQKRYHMPHVGRLGRENQEEPDEINLQLDQ